MTVEAPEQGDAGITRLPSDLLVRVLNYGADRLQPPATVVAVYPQGAGR